MASSRVLARLASIAALLVAAWILVRPATAEARRRIVVLELEGDKAEEFQGELEKFLKKSHSIVPLKKWMSAAEDLSATKVSDKNVKKVAKKLSVDGVIAGSIEKRGSRYYVRLTLRDGTTGKAVTTTELVERSARLSAEGKETLTDELLAAIDELESAGDDGEDEADDDDGGFGGTGMRGRDRDDDDDDDREAKAAKAKAAKAKAARDKRRRDDADEDEDERVADADDEDDGGRRRRRDDDEDDEEDIEIEGEGEEDVETAIDPRARPVDLGVGLSIVARRLSFDGTAMPPPNGYKSNPVAGLTIAADLFPLAFNRKNTSVTRNLGVTLVFDRVIKMSSQYRASDDMVYELGTTEQRYGVGVVYRHLVGKQLTVAVSLRYNSHKFVIDSSPAPTPAAGDIPNVSYTYVDPGLGVRYLIDAKKSIGGDLRYLYVTGTGAMESAERYGDTKASGFELGGRFDYQVGAKLLVRATAGLTRFGMTFGTNGALTTTGEVTGATDMFFGGALTGVYLF